VFSGHIHRNGLYVVHRAAKTDGPAIAGQLMVRGFLEQQIGGVKAPRISSLPHGASGPLFINTTSAGPRGNFKRRSETEAEREKGGLSVGPGYTKIDLAADGSIEKVAFGFIETGVKRTESLGLLETLDGFEGFEATDDGLEDVAETYLDGNLEFDDEVETPGTADPTEWISDSSESDAWHGTEDVEESAWFPAN
jgi:hypothetical protein